MRWLLNLLFWGGVTNLFYGFYHKAFINFNEGDKWIGFGTLVNIYLFTHFFSASLEKRLRILH